jgi:hypothetical protein
LPTNADVLSLPEPGAHAERRDDRRRRRVPIYVDLEHNPMSVEIASMLCVAAIGTGITSCGPTYLR